VLGILQNGGCAEKWRGCPCVDCFFCDSTRVWHYQGLAVCQQFEERGKVIVYHQRQRIGQTNDADGFVCVGRGVGGEKCFRKFRRPVRVWGALGAVG